MSGKPSRRRENAANAGPERPQKLRARDRREIERPRTSRETIAQAVQALAEEDVSEQVQASTVTLWQGIEDRDRAIGDLFAVVDHLLDTTGYTFRGDDRAWFTRLAAKAVMLAGSEVSDAGQQQSDGAP